MNKELFWEKVNQRDIDECWPWTLCKSNLGYGVVRMDGKNQFAHRLAFSFSGGAITSEKPCVLHSCDNPPCCNPAHLRSGTKAENSREMSQKGRAKGKPQPGITNPKAKFSEEEILRIRAECKSGPRGTQAAIARRHGVSDHAISYIVNHGWRHL